MKLLLFSGLFLLAACPLFSEGPPVDAKAKKVTVPHSIITLSDSQVEEVETLGTLTLDSAQWQKLRAIGPNCPKRFSTILPVTWNDCTCGISNYAIQLSRNQVAVVHDQLSSTVGISLDPSESEDTNDPASILLYVDRRGQFYLRGILVPFPKLLELISSTPGKIKNGPEESRRWLGVEYPLGLDRKSAVLKDRLDKLFKTAKAGSWETSDQSE